MSCRLILFDLDGTLLDTLEDLTAAVNRALRALGLPAHPREAVRGHEGHGAEHLARQALPPALRRDDALAARCLRAFRPEYEAGCCEATAPYAGVPELLDALTAQGVRLAILSNKPQPVTSTLARRLLGRWPFEEVLGARPGRPLKPDPTAALDLLCRLRVGPSSAWLVGDSPTDLRTAHNACLRAAAATWGFRSGGALRRAGAQVLLDRPLDLLAWLR